MFRRDFKRSFEVNSGVLHPEHESRNTRVSEYLRKYGQGKIDNLPQDNRPEVIDSRTVDEKLDDGPLMPGLGTDELDVMAELSRMKDKWNNAVTDIETTKKDKQKFDAAVKVINDKNASYQQQRDAFRILEELEKKGKIKK